MIRSDTELIKPPVVHPGCVARNNMGLYTRKMIWSKIWGWENKWEELKKILS